MVTLDYIDKGIVHAFESKEFWRVIPLFNAFSLIRLLPYTKAGPLLTILRAGLRDVPANFCNEATYVPPAVDSPICTVRRPCARSQVDSCVTVVVPAAGRSSRFPGTRPKVYLSNPNGLLMVVDALRGLNLDRVDRILIGVLREHLDQYCSGTADGILECVGKMNKTIEKITEVIVIESETRDPVETVECILVQGQVTGAIFVKDSDNYFECTVAPLNHVVTLKIDRSNESNIFNVASKSFSFCSKDNTISNILEKVIHSSLCNVGGYGFADSSLFLEKVREIRNARSLVAQVPELTMTNVIWSMMLTKETFYSVDSANYQDWGTLSAWTTYCKSFMTLFIDLDGTLVTNSSAFFNPRHGTTEAIESNVAWLRRKHSSGRTYIIITTSRPESYKAETIQQLDALGIPYDRIMFDLMHCQRVLVNDFALTNTFPSAIAINLPRNSGMLPDMMPS